MRYRTGIVDIFRLIFALIIVMYHFYSNGAKHFLGGHLPVEYFGILAGFLLFSKWKNGAMEQRTKDQKIFYYREYMWKRYIKLFWYTVVAFLATFFVSHVWLKDGCTPGKIADLISRYVWEMLNLEMSGINAGKGLLIGASWTMSCMLIAEFFVLGMLTFFEQIYLTFIMPCSLIIGVGIWMNLESVGPFAFLGISTTGTLHMYLLTIIGIVTWQVCDRLKKRSFSQAGRHLLTAIEFGSYIFCIWVCCYRNTRHYQLCVMLAISIALCISFSDKSDSRNIFPSSPITNLCAEYSLSLYLSHTMVLYCFSYWYPDVNDRYRQKFVFLIATAAVGLAYMLIMRGVFKMLPIVKQKAKSIILQKP